MTYILKQLLTQSTGCRGGVIWCRSLSGTWLSLCWSTCMEYSPLAGPTGLIAFSCLLFVSSLKFAATVQGCNHGLKVEGDQGLGPSHGTYSCCTYVTVLFSIWWPM